ncbi:unnamed protein product [Caenorhabditis angaria]|uniref:Uncharacterized protein n=1 Tax=Caenorhabditis angaria TaxID=860376 RepID=A0A9P1IFQ6_9PELO|nr:unnamed protein product [Caenorhabditis angaria]
MARTMDPATSNSPFATTWTQDSWYNVYSWVNSQSNDSETTDSSVRSSTSSSQPQTSPALQLDDHPLLSDRPSPVFFNNSSSVNNLPSYLHQQQPGASLNTEKYEIDTWNNPPESDYNLIHELLKLNLNTSNANTQIPQPIQQVTPPPMPANNSPWSLPPDDSLFSQLYHQQQQQNQQLQEQQRIQSPVTTKNEQWAVMRYNMMMQLQTKLDETTEEYRQLEKERKQTEAELARHNLGKKISSSNGLPIPRLPTAPSRVDRLIVDFFREHARISTLLAKMEQLRGGQIMPMEVHRTLADLLDAVSLLQHNRNHERAAILQQLRGENVHYDEEKESAELCNALHLVRHAATRVRAANWCSLITTLTPLDAQQKSQLDRIVESGYTISPPPIRPRPINI